MGNPEWWEAAGEAFGRDLVEFDVVRQAAQGVAAELA
jgi:hypothetical protein